MAVYLIKQRINGKQVNSMDIEVAGQDEVDAILSLSAGFVEVFEEKASGGTAVAEPEQLRRSGFSALKKVGRSYKSASFRVPHLKSSKTARDVSDWAIGKLDCSYDLEEKCEKCNEFVAR